MLRASATSPPSPTPLAAGASKVAPTMIGVGIQIVGDVFAREDVEILGAIEGRIFCNGNITVSAGAKVSASVEASSVVVIGDIQGTVKADKIDVRKTARLVGDIRCARVVVQDGAYLKGSIDISKPTPAKRKLALQESREAEELDRIAESDIEAGRYSTLSDDLRWEDLFSKGRRPVRQILEQPVAKTF